VPVRRFGRLRRATRRRRNGLLSAGIAIAFVASGVALVQSRETSSQEADNTDLVAATKQPLANTLFLPGAIDTVPATPLTGQAAGSRVEWLVEDGAVVRRGEPLFRELGPIDPAALADLRRRQEKARADLAAAQQGASADTARAQDSLNRATEARADAVRRLEPAEQDRAAITAAEAALADARSRGEEGPIQTATTALDAANAAWLETVNRIRGEINTATDQMDGALAELARLRVDTEPKVAEAKRIADDLTAQLNRNQSGNREAVAAHEGVVSIRTDRVPEGDRVVGELQPPRHILVVDIDPQLLYKLPESVDEASVAVDGGPEFACDGLELATVGAEGEGAPGSEVVVRCLVPDNQRVFAKSEGELRVVVGRLSDALVVPAAAVRTTSPTTATVKVQGLDGEVVGREIETGGTDGEFVAVTKGLSLGERVVVEKPGRRR
jgi:multidrug efflux pump subunit AcrA (membrane-fusion protein)